MKYTPFYSIDSAWIYWFDILVSKRERGLHVTEHLWVTYDLLSAKFVFCTFNNIGHLFETPAERPRSV
jgi:hypothetical protein